MKIGKCLNVCQLEDLLQVFQLYPPVSPLFSEKKNNFPSGAASDKYSKLGQKRRPSQECFYTARLPFVRGEPRHNSHDTVAEVACQQTCGAETEMSTATELGTAGFFLAPLLH